MKVGPRRRFAEDGLQSRAVVRASRPHYPFSPGGFNFCVAHPDWPNGIGSNGIDRVGQPCQTIPKGGERTRYASNPHGVRP
jgi:hypothetical protein